MAVGLDSNIHSRSNSHLLLFQKKGSYLNSLQSSPSRSGHLGIVEQFRWHVVVDLSYLSPPRHHRVGSPRICSSSVGQALLQGKATSDLIVACPGTSSAVPPGTLQKNNLDLRCSRTFLFLAIHAGQPLLVVDCSHDCHAHRSTASTSVPRSLLTNCLRKRKATAFRNFPCISDGSNQTVSKTTKLTQRGAAIDK